MGCKTQPASQPKPIWPQLPNKINHAHTLLPPSCTSLASSPVVCVRASDLEHYIRPLAIALFHQRKRAVIHGDALVGTPFNAAMMRMAVKNRGDREPVDDLRHARTT